MLLAFSLLSLGQGGPGAPASVPAARQAKNVAVITIRDDGGIDSVTAKSVARRLRLAHHGGADAVVIDLDTPGGEGSAVLAISTAIKDSPVANTVAWINPRAYSGGAIIAWACREIVAAPSAAVGDALPIILNPKTKRLEVVEGKLLMKILPPLMADLVESARRFGRDEYLVQAMTNDTVELWLVRERSTGRLLCIDADEYQRLFGEPPSRGLPRIPAASARRAGDAPAPAVAPSPSPGPLPAAQQYRPASPALEGIAREVDRQLGKQGGATASERPSLSAADRERWELVTYLCNGTGPVVLKHDDLELLGISSGTIANDEELRAFFGAKNLTRLDPSWSEGLVAFLTLMPVQGVLLVVFLLALFIEMTHPGAMLPGAISFVALAGLIAPPLLINLSAWWAVAAILTGMLLIVLEVLVIPGFGVIGVAGLLLLFGGLIGVLVPAGSLFPETAAERQDLLYGVATLALALATSVVGMSFFAKHFGSLPVLGRLVLQNPVWDDDGGSDEMLAAMADPAGPIKRGVAGVTLTPLRPAGRVEVGEAGGGGRIIDAVAEIGYIPAGCRVRVVSVSDFRIGVERIDGPGGPPGDRAA